VEKLGKDRLIGGLILAASLMGIGVYAWLLHAYALIVLQVTAFAAIAAVLGILAWIGYTMATTPPPASVEPESMEPTDEKTIAEERSGR
jgi:predicted DNA-binding transcriptional regulator